MPVYVSVFYILYDVRSLADRRRYLASFLQFNYIIFGEEMRSFLITISLIILSSFTRGNFQDDTVEVQISDSVMVKAVQKTNSQVDSIFLGQVKPITFHDLSNVFDGITSHIDSLNAAAIILAKQRDSIMSVRHKEQMARIDLINKNIELRKENKRKEDTISLAKTAPHVLMTFMSCMAAVLLVQGGIAGMKKIKK